LAYTSFHSRSLGAAVLCSCWAAAIFFTVSVQRGIPPPG
jgi:hypothetical protein